MAGRRPGPSSSRADILAAARDLFAEKGYDSASVRAIARSAEVDPALVHHFFGSKEQLFVAAMEFPVEPSSLVPRVLAGPREEVGERLVRMFTSLWGDPAARPQLLAILRSAATGDEGSTMFREFAMSRLLGPIAEALEVPQIRVNAAAAQMVGVMLLRYLLRIEPIASASEEDLVALLAPTIQRYLAP